MSWAFNKVYCSPNHHTHIIRLSFLPHNNKYLKIAITRTVCTPFSVEMQNKKYTNIKIEKSTIQWTVKTSSDPLSQIELYFIFNLFDLISASSYLILYTFTL